MSTVELIASFTPGTGLEIEPAANTAPRVAGRDELARAATARGFLIQLVAREVQLLERGASWLNRADMGELAGRSVALREELVVLIHHLVARWNRSEGRRRLDVFALLDQPLTGAIAELIDLHERQLAGPMPWLELAVLRPLEQMLAGMVPLAIDVASFHARGTGLDAVDDSDLAAAARLFGARKQRSREIESALQTIIAADPRRSAIVVEVEEQAIAIFTRLLTECAKIGPELDCWRYGFVR